VLTFLPLEDTWHDVVGKAMRGFGLTTTQVALRAGIPLAQLESVLAADTLSPKVAPQLAHVLGLDATTLFALAQYHPSQHDVTILPHGVAVFTTPFADDMTVNAYVVWDPQTREAATFDSGTSADALLAFVREQGLTLRFAFITHTHWDHVLAVREILNAPEAQTAKGFGPGVENPLGLQPIAGSAGFCLGGLTIRTLATPGHTPGGLSYHIEGLSQPLLVVGDALFAGSMGGVPFSQHEAYRQAHQTIRGQLLSKSPETLILPGHGPVTTVARECQHNPFFAGQASVPS